MNRAHRDEAEQGQRYQIDRKNLHLLRAHQLEADEIAVVGHHGCGMTGLSPGTVLDNARQRGISPDVLETLSHSGVDLQKWLTGMESPEAGVLASVKMIRNHPLLPKEVPVLGLIMHPETGRLEVLSEGNAAGSALDSRS